MEVSVRVVNVTFDVFNNVGTATCDDGSKFEIDRLEHDSMLYDIKKKGAHVFKKKDYSQFSFHELMNSI